MSIQIWKLKHTRNYVVFFENPNTGIIYDYVISMTEKKMLEELLGKNLEIGKVKKIDAKMYNRLIDKLSIRDEVYGSLGVEK